jgi:hypothetical protein
MARSVQPIRNPSLLAAALEGLELQRQRIDEQIKEVRVMLGQVRAKREKAAMAAATKPAVAKRPARRLSPAARKRIAAAQKRRWAEYRKAGNHKSE